MSEELNQRVLKVIATSKRIPPETVTIDSEFTQLNIDSMDAVEILFALENEARLLANKEAEKTRKVLEEQLNQKLAEAEKSIAATRDAAMANVRGIATEAARAIVERLIGAVPAGVSVEAAVDDSLKV